MDLITNKKTKSWTTDLKGPKYNPKIGDEAPVVKVSPQPISKSDTKRLASEAVENLAAIVKKRKAITLVPKIIKTPRTDRWTNSANIVGKKGPVVPINKGK